VFLCSRFFLLMRFDGHRTENTKNATLNCSMKPLSTYLSFDDVLLLPQPSAISSRSQIDLKTQITPSLKLDLPLIAINMDTVTGVDMAIAISHLGGIAFYPRFDTIDHQVTAVKKILDSGERVIPAIGIKDSEKDRLRALVALGINTVTIDVAHAHLKICLDFIRWAKKEFKSLEIIAGVVATYQGACDLYSAGASAVRVGMGIGSICTTRVQTGHGVPQISALLDCARASKKFHRPLIADGGTKNSGDIVKSLACGASAVVCGYLFAGTDETPGEIITQNGQKFKDYNGSTSQVEKLSQFAKNGHDKSPAYTSHIEGIAGLVPVKGPLSEVVSSLESGIRSGFSYSGAFNLDQFRRRAKFIRVTPAITYENTHRPVFSS